LKVGDVITSVDGVDVSGANFRQFSTLTRAPPGTALAIATQRGVTVQLVLAAP
jgi:C-terminal processing protease CtpA/Prc